MTETIPPQVRAFMRQIQMSLPTRVTIEAAAAAVLDDFQAITGAAPSPDVMRNLEAAIERVRSDLAPVEIVHRISISDHALRRWYAGPKPGDVHWPALKEYLLTTKGWHEETVASIDASSGEVVASLADPHESRFSHKGLVVGYVQSGKTANMTGVIAKAIDAGYNTIVILAGLTNKLRAQTQRRLDTDLRGRHSHLWLGYTSAHVAKDDDDTEENGDFVVPPDRRFAMPAPGRVQYAVIKKETTRLEKFMTTIESTPKAILEQLRVLLIDDECDQASVNASTKENGITKTNELLRRIIGLLPACAYVGYTATPFANVFINPFPNRDDVPDDLYPRHFIASLPRPEGYVGTLEVFGTIEDGAEREDDEADGRPMVRTVPKEEVAKLRPARIKDKDTFVPEITRSLEDALLWFIASCAVRRRRGHSDSHMTMLVHTSPHVAQHQSMTESIKMWIATNNADLRAMRGDVWTRLEDVFAGESGRFPLVPQDSGLTAATLHEWINEVLDVLEPVIENGVSDERLDFTRKPKTYIVVGGSVLARGLTLEGLSVSFFLRTSKQYDTLLQMGRWFGFRQGYEDLPRLWAPADLIDAFRAIGRVEEEVRADIARYLGNPRFTPLDFAVRVRKIPGLAITSAAKMGASAKVAMSYAGRHVQTTGFDHRKAGVIGANWEAVEALVSNCVASGRAEKSRDGVRLFENVPVNSILKFLKSYTIADSLELTSKSLIAYTLFRGEALSSWNVAFVGPAKPVDVKEIEGLGVFGLTRRSKLSESREDHANIKALMSKSDILADVKIDIAGAGDKTWDELKALRPEVPLLLVYALDKVSEPRPGSKTRVPLNAVDHIPAIGLVFPGATEASGSFHAVRLEVDPPVLVDVSEEEAEEAENP